MFLLIVLSLGVVPVFVLVTILYLNKLSCSHSFQVLKQHGINSPRPLLFYGNYRQKIKMGTTNFSKQLHSDYGTIAGFYVGQERTVSVIDLELMKRILVKDFDHFIDRSPWVNTTLPEGLLTTNGDKWRSMRQILSPSFSPFKMKAMTPLILRSVESLVNVFEEYAHSENSVETFSVFSAFTLEVILATAFGHLAELQKGQSNRLTEAAAQIFNVAREGKMTSEGYMTMLLSNFPWLMPGLAFLARYSSRVKAIKFLSATAKEILMERRKENKTEKYKDLLQLMIDAAAEGKEGSTRKLTDSQIVDNAITFMLAGYETTANALGYTSYLLALNPHVQGKLQVEIDLFMQQNPEATLYQVAQDLEYLDMVFQESLRLYPPAPMFSRYSSKDYSYEGITIPKNTTVVFPVQLLHTHPKFWTDPEEFDPLRFSAEEKARRPPLCYMPFGHGPRSCIGSRFALLEAKLALIQLLRRFSFVRAPDTQVPLETMLGITMVPKNGIYLKLATRNN